MDGPIKETNFFEIKGSISPLSVFEKPVTQNGQESLTGAPAGENEAMGTHQCDINIMTLITENLKDNINANLMTMMAAAQQNQAMGEAATGQMNQLNDTETKDMKAPTNGWREFVNGMFGDIGYGIAYLFTGANANTPSSGDTSLGPDYSLGPDCDDSPGPGTGGNNAIGSLDSFRNSSDSFFFGATHTDDSTSWYSQITPEQSADLSTQNTTIGAMVGTMNSSMSTVAKTGIEEPSTNNQQLANQIQQAIASYAQTNMIS